MYQKAYGAIGGLCKRAGAIVVVTLAFGVGASADETRIAILGDSLVAGYGLRAEEGLVPKLQAWLDGHNASVSLQNAGVSGDTTAGGLARLDWTLSPDVNALIVSLGANDMLRGLPVAGIRSNLDAIVAGAQRRSLPVLLVGFGAPLNWGPEYKTGFDAIYPALAAKHKTLLIPSFFAPLSDDGSTAVAMKYLQPDGLHPNPKGVALLVEVIGPYIIQLAGQVN